MGTGRQGQAAWGARRYAFTRRPEEGGRDRCGGAVIRQRADETAETVRAGVSARHEQTAPPGIRHTVMRRVTA